MGLGRDRGLCLLVRLVLEADLGMLETKLLDLLGDVVSSDAFANGAHDPVDGE